MQANSLTLGVVEPLRNYAQSQHGQPRLVSPAQISRITRGALGQQAHALLGIGAVGGAKLGHALPGLERAFSSESGAQLATPWLAARSLAKPVEGLPTQSTSSWILAGRPRG